MSNVTLRWTNTLIIYLVVTCVTTLWGNARAQSKSELVGQNGVSTQNSVVVVGRVIARRTGFAVAHITGPIDKFYADVGGRVKRDQVLVKLEGKHQSWSRARRAATLQQRKAELATRRALVAKVELEAKRLQQLRKIRSGAFRAAQFDNVELELVVLRSKVIEAQAVVLQARADLALADLDLKNIAIVAPFSGIIIERFSEIGAFVHIGDKLLSIIDDSTLEIEADVPRHLIRFLSLGDIVKSQIAGKSIDAMVRIIIPSENLLTNTQVVRFSATFGADRVAVNQSVELVISEN